MIPHNIWRASDEDRAAVSRVLDSGHVGQGPETEAFEREIGERFGRDACAVSSGTAALYLALRAEGIWTGDSVLVPTYACSALYNAVRMTGASVELGDVLPSTFALDPRIKPRHRVKATVYVHTYGVPGEIPGGLVIEDITHALGESYNGKLVGTMGSLAIASLGPTKLLGTPGGGVVLGSTDRIAFIRDLRDYDGKRNLRDRFNFQWNDVAAAIGRVRLARLDRDLERRQHVALLYDTELGERGDIARHGGAQPNTYTFYRYIIRPERALWSQSEFRNADIETIVPLWPHELLHRMAGEDRQRFPVAESVALHTLSLPIYPEMTDDEVARVCDVLGRLEA